MRTIRIILIPFALVILVLSSIFVSGYINLLDMPWGPLLKVESFESNTFLLSFLLRNITYIVSSEILQKLILIIIIVASYVGAVRFIKVINKNSNNIIGCLVALLYLFNPFFYTRFINGQWLVMAGYCLLPIAITKFYIFLITPNKKNAWQLLIISSLISLVSIHTIGIFLIAATGIFIGMKGKVIKKQIILLGSVIIAWIGINLTWLIPFFLGNSWTARAIAQFGMPQMDAYATIGTIGHSVPLSAALLTGFWADDQNRYILPSSLPFWWIGVAILFSVILFGIFLTIKRKDRLGITFLVLGIVAWLLGMGIAWPPSALLTDAIIKILPVYNGYREPQKWLMLLALVYVYFLAIGATRILDFIKEKWSSNIPRYAFITLLAIAPFLYTPTLAWGAAGQLKSVDYPKGWYDAKVYLNSHTNKEDTVLVLPWHIYLPLSWVGRVVANPAPYFFDQKLITSDQVELAGVPPDNSTPVQSYVSNQIIPNLTTLKTAGAKLKPYGITYILLEKESDYKRYQPFLDRQTDLQRVYDNANISIYKVTAK